MHTLPAHTQEISIWIWRVTAMDALFPCLETPSRRRPDFAHGAKLKLWSIIFTNSDPCTLHWLGSRAQIALWRISKIRS